MPKRGDTISADIAEPRDPTVMLSVKEAARILGVSERSVRRRVAAGELPAMRRRGAHGSEVGIDWGALTAYRLLQSPGREEPNRAPGPTPLGPPAIDGAIGSAAEPSEPLAGADMAVRHRGAPSRYVADSLERALDENACLRTSLDRALNRALDDNAFLRARLINAEATSQEGCVPLSQSERDLQRRPEPEGPPPSSQPPKRRRQRFRPV